MRAARLARWFLLSALLLACGGRLVKTDGEGDGDDGTGTGASSDGQGASTGSGASPGRAGSIGTGASTSQGGATTGTAGSFAVGGAVSTAGTSAAAGSCNCPMLACPPGTQPVPNRGGCCYSCQPVCPDIPCPPIACGSGSHLEVRPGECCPTCVMDICEDQRMAYRRMREQLLEKYRMLGCMTHQDCGIYYEKNACEIGCGLVAPSGAFEYLDQNLVSFAALTCGPECVPQPLPCEPPAQPICVNGLCQ